MDEKQLLPTWARENNTYLSTLAASSSLLGFFFVVIGSVLTSIFRKVPQFHDLVQGCIAFLVVGIILFLFGMLITFYLFMSRKQLPKTSSAAKAELPPDPNCLAPVYPRNSPLPYKAVVHGPQILVLPGGVDPVYVSFRSPSPVQTI